MLHSELSKIVSLWRDVIPKARCNFGGYKTLCDALIASYLIFITTGNCVPCREGSSRNVEEAMHTFRAVRVKGIRAHLRFSEGNFNIWNSLCHHPHLLFLHVLETLEIIFGYDSCTFFKCSFSNRQWTIGML